MSSESERERVLAQRINSTNPSQLELELANRPGGPESLEEAVERLQSGPDAKPSPERPSL